MTPEKIELVRKTWAMVSGSPELVAELFYARLFELAPSVRPLFPEDMAEQGKKLMQMLAVAVGHLDKLENVTPALIALAERHVGYGAVAEHYPVVGEALLDTLQKGLAEEFTPEVEEAWTEVYGLLCSVMIDAVAEA